MLMLASIPDNKNIFYENTVDEYFHIMIEEAIESIESFSAIVSNCKYF